MVDPEKGDKGNELSNLASSTGVDASSASTSPKHYIGHCHDHGHCSSSSASSSPPTTSAPTEKTHLLSAKAPAAVPFSFLKEAKCTGHDHDGAEHKHGETEKGSTTGSAHDHSGHDHAAHDHAGHDHSGHDHDHAGHEQEEEREDGDAGHGHDHDHSGHGHAHKHGSDHIISALDEHSDHGHGGEASDVNIEAAYMHVLTDLIQSIGVAIAGAVFWWKPHWQIIDPLCTFIFSVIALRSTLPLINRIGMILFEGTPSHVSSTV